MPSARPATVLVLEKNPAVRELIDEALRESGYLVLTTQSALEALEVLRRVRIDVLVAGDLADEQGDTVAGELRSVQPESRIVSICGRDDGMEKIDRCVSLSNPFSLDDLQVAVATSLEHPGGR